MLKSLFLAYNDLFIQISNSLIETFISLPCMHRSKPPNQCLPWHKTQQKVEKLVSVVVELPQLDGIVDRVGMAEVAAAMALSHNPRRIPQPPPLPAFAAVAYGRQEQAPHAALAEVRWRHGRGIARL